MKKILTILLSVVIVAALGVGAYLLFAPDKAEDDDVVPNMTIAEARQLITTACEDLGLEFEGEDQYSAIINNADVDRLFVDYEEYISYDYYDLFNQNQDTVKVNLLWAKMLLDDEEVEKDTFYSSTSILYEENITALIYFNIKGNSIHMSMQEASAKMQWNTVLTKQSEEEWTINGCANGLMNSEGSTYNFGKSDVYLVYSIKKTSEGIIEYIEDSVYFVSEIDSVEDIKFEDVARLEIFERDKLNEKRRDYIYYKEDGLGDSEVTSENIINKAKATFNSYNKVKVTSFENRTFEDSDFLEKVYIYLGYIEA